MHSLAIALHHMGHTVTGSDDEIFDPSRSNLAKAGILPSGYGWFPERINPELDAVILGMHAQKDNPELQKALQLGLKIYSFPDFLYHQTKDKLRVVIAGSHGKTTITSMVMHVLKYHNYGFDYMVGSRLEGFDNMVHLDEKSNIAVFEGDEYLASCLDPRPKFLLYKPKIALISGISWDHINVFPTWESYVKQFRLFIESLPHDGCLVYCAEDSELMKLAQSVNPGNMKLPYSTHDYEVSGNTTWLIHDKIRTQVRIFGRHNMQNISGARRICNQIGIGDGQFYKAIAGFKGSAKRLELLGQNASTIIYNDFAHSPSKVAATISALKEQYPEKKLVAFLELHTYSSLNKHFLGHYEHTMDRADRAVIYYSPETILHKRLDMITHDDVIKAFGRKDLDVFTNRVDLEKYLGKCDMKNTVLLLMSSGNFSGMDIKALTTEILTR